MLAVDHDHLFKELLTTFFVEFLELFFPKLAARLDRESIQFLPQEVFTDLIEGDVYRTDLLAQARFQGEDAYFLIHLENQSTAPPSFPERFFRYFAGIYLRRRVPIYPIVIYSHDAPKRAQPKSYRIGFPDGHVMRFNYHVVQLNRLSWRSFVNRPNPIASALMAKMKVADRDRPKVKAECLRLLVTLKLDRARMKLIATFVDRYLRLTKAEEALFKLSLERTDWPQEQKEGVMEILTSWELRGMEMGMALGIQQGIEEGERRTLRKILRDLLTSRFGPLDGSIAARLAALESLEELRTLTHRAFTAQSLQELGF